MNAKIKGEIKEIRQQTMIMYFEKAIKKFNLNYTNEKIKKYMIMHSISITKI